MKNVRLKASIYAVTIVSAIAWTILAWMSGVNLSAARDFFGLIPKVVTLDVLVVVVFTKWGWKLRCFRGWLVPFPNLHGTWTGSIFSDWINPDTKQGIPPIPVMLTVNQSFSHISCMMHTGEMKSYSVVEGFNIDIDRQIKQLAYVYTSKPRVVLNERSVPHDGAMVFDILELPSRKLTGRYWTERKTKGEVNLSFHGDALLEELPASTPSHPVTESDKRWWGQT